MKVAVVGATGAVGREMTRILEERRFPVDAFVPLASSRSAGRTVRFVETITRCRSCHSTRSAAWTWRSSRPVRTYPVPSSARRPHRARPASTTPAPSGWNPTCRYRSRGESRVARRVAEDHRRPELHHDHHVARDGPLHRAAGLRSLMISSYQSVSGAGWKGTRELVDQVGKLRGQEEDLGSPDTVRCPSARCSQDDRLQRGREDRRVRCRRLYRRRNEDHGRAPQDPRHP